MKADLAEGEVLLKQLNVLLPYARHRALKAKCAMDGITMAQAVEELVRLYVSGKVKLPEPGKE
jgi:hypothetical protein